MGPKPSFFVFVKCMIRDSSKVRYTEHSVILLKIIEKKRHSPSMVGEKLKESRSGCLKNNMETSVVALEHGTYLCLGLQLGPLFFSLSYRNYESSYSFISYKECPDHRCTIFGHVLLSQCFQVIFFMPTNVKGKCQS